MNNPHEALPTTVEPPKAELFDRSPQMIEAEAVVTFDEVPALSPQAPIEFGELASGDADDVQRLAVATDSEQALPIETSDGKWSTRKSLRRLASVTAALTAAGSVLIPASPAQADDG